METRFKFCKDKKIILYGAAYLGKLFCDTLEKQGFVVDAYIDARAEEISEMNEKKVYTVLQAAQIYSEKDVIIVLAVKNVFEHSKIANLLCKHGFNNLVFKPYEIIKGKGTKEQNELSKLFDDIQDNVVLREQTLIKTLKANYLAPSEKYLIGEDGDYCLVYLPINCIAQDRMPENDKTDINVLYLYPHLQFFAFLQGDKTAGPEAYLDYCKRAAMKVGGIKTTKLWEKNILRNRTLVYEEMNVAFLIDRHFFIRSGAKVEYNSLGYFNLMSGKHRTTFLISKGLSHIPVKMTKKDYELWVKEDKAKEIFEKFLNRGIYELVAPIEHPYFYEYPCGGRSFFEQMIVVLARHFCKLWYNIPNENIMDGKRVYLEVNDMGYLSRHFRRLGCEVFDANKDTEREMLEELFDIKNKVLERQPTDYHIAVLQVETIEAFRERFQRIKAKHIILMIREEDLSEYKAKRLTGGVCGNEALAVYYINGEEQCSQY